MGEEERREWTLASVDQEEWAEVVTNLLDGQDTITLEELFSLEPQMEEDAQLLGALVDQLDQLGVSVVENEEAEESDQKETVAAVPDLDSIGTEDLLDVYLAELTQVPLLSRDEEVALAQEIELGRQAEKALEETDYTANEFTRLRELVEEGQAARAHLGRANTRLVVSIAKRYRGYGIPFTDLIQNGNVGLMRAVDHYDHRTGYRFSTYATWWIRQAVTRSLSNHGRVIRIPVHTGARIRKMTQVAARLEVEQGQRPTAKDIAEVMNESPEKVRQLMRWVGDAVSLERPVGAEKDIELQDLLEDQNTPQPEEMTDYGMLTETVRLLIGQLSVREAQILRMRYGLDGAETYTLAEIGQKLNLSRERIRQLERQALARLRLVAPYHRLDQYL